MQKENMLSPNIISLLNNLSIKARYVVEGFIVGLHKSPYHGFSVEFSEHRAYGIGDEIRHVDWELWGKTDRYFVKLVEEENQPRYESIKWYTTILGLDFSNVIKTVNLIKPLMQT